MLYLVARLVSLSSSFSCLWDGMSSSSSGVGGGGGNLAIISAQERVAGSGWAEGAREP